jgi:3-hydroxyisobutyrate dehydrogenase-like beta-hydroxyacid dehydrogenase
MPSGPRAVGIVGVGEMGRPVVDRLRAAGHDVTAFVRRPERAAALAQEGVDVAASVEAMAAGRDVVILFVYTDAQVREVALGTGLVEAMDPGSILVIHTTGSPLTAEAIAGRAAARGVGLIDAPVSGGPHKIVAGTITLLVGGAADDVERCRPVLGTYADPILHLGPLGTGQRVKLINNAMFGAHVQLAVEAVRVGRSFGIEAGALATTLGHCSGASFALELVAAFGSPEALVAGAGRFVHKDVLVAGEVAQELGADLGLLRSVLDPLLDATTPGGRP